MRTLTDMRTLFTLIRVWLTNEKSAWISSKERKYFFLGKGDNSGTYDGLILISWLLREEKKVKNIIFYQFCHFPPLDGIIVGYAMCAKMYLLSYNVFALKSKFNYITLLPVEFDTSRIINIGHELFFELIRLKKFNPPIFGVDIRSLNSQSIINRYNAIL